VHALIIEQDMWIILMIEDVLRELGYTSFAYASSPQGAITAAGERCPDLITSEIRPGAGTDIEAVRQICSAKAIPVVFVTATPWEVREIDASAIVVPKPFGQNALKQGVASAAGRLAC
jgi:CheY-like chemotaxis protein